MDKKEFLLRYQSLQVKMEKKRSLIEALRCLSLSTSKIMNEEKELKKLVEESKEIKKEIMKAIENLDDYLQSLIIYRYLDGMTWNKIADKLFCCEKTIRRWHEKALSLLEIPK